MKQSIDRPLPKQTQDLPCQTQLLFPKIVKEAVKHKIGITEKPLQETHKV